MRRRWWLPVSLALGLGPVVGPPVAAQPVESENRAAARALGKEGVELYRQGEYAAALDRLSRAHAVVGLTTTGLWRAKCLAKLGRLVEADEQYLAVTRMKLGDDASAKHRAAIDEARQARRALQPRIPKVRLVAPADDGTPFTVEIDGKPVPAVLIGVPRPIDPGEHQLVLRAGGSERRRTFPIGEGELLELPLELGGSAAGGAAPSRPAPPAPVARPGASPHGGASADSSGPSAQGMLGWVAVGLGGAGLVAGAVTGGVALGSQSTLDDGCPGGDCPPDLHDDVDRFEAFRLASTVSLVVGGAVAVGGVTLLLTAPSDAGQEPQAHLRLAPTGLLLIGTFD